MYKITDKYQSRIDVNNNILTISFLQEPPSYIKTIYENLKVSPTINYTSPFQLSLTNKELSHFIVLLMKKLLCQVFNTVKFW